MHWAQCLARTRRAPMMVMPGNHSSPEVHFWAGRYPGKIGWLIGPTAAPKTKLRTWMPFALDNDAFTAWTTQQPWNEQAWLDMLSRIRQSNLRPQWVLVPDQVADAEATLRLWSVYAPVAARYGWPLAFAVQDGMTPSDVPPAADVVFVGGTSRWKWSTVESWVATGRPVHVGRVNTVELLETCDRLGVQSADGTGWFRDPTRPDKMLALHQFIEGRRTTQIPLL
jgi:hypothetical protein